MATPAPTSASPSPPKLGSTAPMASFKDNKRTITLQDQANIATAMETGKIGDSASARENTMGMLAEAAHSSNQGVHYEIPKTIWENAPFGEEWNVRHGTYTAVHTRNPINFTTDGYMMRPTRDGQRIKMLVCCTAYNEGEPEFQRTLMGVNHNVKSLMKMEGQDAWRSVYVIVVSDGRRKANSASTAMLQTDYGVYDEDIMITCGDGSGKQVFMHLFEHTTQLVDDPNHQTYHPPVQMCHALKEFNGGKLDSHLWFFNGFADHLDPKYCFLLDIGTAPRARAMVKLYKCMEEDRQVAGCCGEIACWQPNLLNPVVATQHFEYKVSHVLDKSLESIFGFTSVLPGAFSAYRYSAIREENGEGPLVEYFRSITTEMKDLGPFKGNMYLAEDRILCYELIARQGCNWVLRYVKNAVAETDVPEDLTTLIKQRRRWLNGSFFAILYAILNFNRLWTRSNHSFVRKCFYTLQFFYYIVQTFSSFTLIGSFYVFYYIIIDATFTGQTIVRNIFVAVYAIMILLNLIMGLGNTPDSMQEVYSMMMTLGSVLSLGTLALTVYFLIGAEPLIQYAAAFSFGFYFAAGIVHGEFLQLLQSAVQYFMMLPTTINVLMIYAFCNTHDLSWGTKGLSEDSHKNDKKDAGATTGQMLTPAELRYQAKIKQRAQQKKERQEKEKNEMTNAFRAFRTYLLFSLVLINGTLAIAVSSSVSGADNGDLKNYYLWYIFGLVCFFNGMRFFGAICYMANRSAKRCCGKRKKKLKKNTHQVPVRHAKIKRKSQLDLGKGGAPVMAAPASPTASKLPQTFSSPITGPTSPST